MHIGISYRTTEEHLNFTREKLQTQNLKLLGPVYIWLFVAKKTGFEIKNVFSRKLADRIY
ncbi:MAG: hypothetical protein ACD_70C00107G0006 [uncultured bacterium]|nr:MAG: hypothetical protein ACD_70C00107G0006 [uncultured bacterium]OGT26083.1 MAG: hypothetical protein A3B71_04290 [Gammaproteobacteria bacterium RIFCSPHIGHO2_02_FULL_42_43]OGT29358.1 MAG: hypothetical protein A2624_06135 [Gammaproteobacteria bacterium RIFCSPHIGHO2_01_FULL_42_8]OGT50895.1 MAG: hypothetical protein A3E54_03940 [Gammaproteobacteria bacterium RIFCSPHIGHO2_12_FULL_41_25]OGT62825.1 MAG: hypothetical protein A3I77_00185 [Gammaproteobacteria bacterium RIFCSPLOWO2_02_FULL_42_14]OGT